MHMADALLSPEVGAAFWAGTIGAIGYASKKLGETPDERRVPLMGVLGAFVFAAQMINFTIPATGSSGHLAGGMLLSILLGPWAAFLVMASVLTVQALFFADGGLLALGCNIWNLGIYPCFVACPLIYRPLARSEGGSRRRAVAAVFASLVAIELGALSVVLQTALSGRAALPLHAFLPAMAAIHLFIGLAEGLVTAGIIGFISRVRPEFAPVNHRTAVPGTGPLSRSVFGALLALVLLAGGAVSWLASEKPDGLEWSILKSTAGGGLPEHERGPAATLKTVQEKTSILPDYGFRGDADSAGRAGRSVSGMLGPLIVLVFVVLAGFCLRLFRRRGAKKAGNSCPDADR